MGLLYDYTYLTANGYLQKFRNALNAPYLNRAELTKILKIFNDRYKLVRFIVKNEKGIPCLYHKDTLNRILGIDRTGITVMNPKSNNWLNAVRDISDGLDEKEYASQNTVYEPTDYSSDEENMQKMSDRLANLEEGFDVKKALKRMMKRRGKKITITESQFSELKKRLNEEFFVETEKVKIVKKYLDDNFVRGTVPAMGEDGYPKYIGVVGMKFKDGTVAKNMTATQLFYLLQDKFQKIYEDPKQRDAFLKKIVTDWYYKRISRHGLLSKNKY